MNNLDKTDIEILLLLQSNSELTTKEVAEKINLSVTPTFERIKKLKNEGFIKKYVAVLNKNKLGFNLVAFCNISLKEHSKLIGEQVVKDLGTLIEVTEIYNISGQFDFLLKIVVKDMPEYQNFILNKLGSIPNIGSSHSIFVMAEIKNDFSIPLKN